MQVRSFFLVDRLRRHFGGRVLRNFHLLSSLYPRNFVVLLKPQKNTMNMPENEHSLSLHADGPDDRVRCSNCVRRTMLLIITSMLLLSVAILIAWQVLNPHNPDFRLNSISVSNVTLPDSHFIGTYEVEFNVNNTNKKVGLSVDYAKISVLFKHEMVSDKTLEENVYVKEMSQVNLQAHFGPDSGHKIKKDVFKDLSDAWSKKIVDFQVNIAFRIVFEYRFWPSKVRFMEAVCKNVTVEFRTTRGTGKLMSGGNCLVH